MSHLRLACDNSNNTAPRTPLSSVKCKMLRASWSPPPNTLSVSEKIALLKERRPIALSILEGLVDRLLAER
ncbi:MAG TPA: hypothetical protein VNJ04_12160 [Gemmatimonadaceae bacterium]|nr:hypothetical protein [Gemmatimonadaceae bacterium]